MFVWESMLVLVCCFILGVLLSPLNLRLFRSSSFFLGEVGEYWKVKLVVGVIGCYCTSFDLVFVYKRFDFLFEAKEFEVSRLRECLFAVR